MTRLSKLLILGAAVLLTSAAIPVGSGDRGSGPGDAIIAEDGTVESDVILRFHQALPSHLDAWAEERDGHVLATSHRLAWASLRFPSPAAADRALEDARAWEAVAGAEHDGVVETHLVPDDPRYAEQWGFPAIEAEAAWERTLGSHDVSVAVLDTGVDVDHPDLEANLCGPHASFVPSEPFVNDLGGHGTHTSGTVAAVTDNGLGVAGTSQSCIMHGKVLAGSGGGQWSWVAQGIEWAATNGARVISMSLGGGSPPGIVLDAIQLAYEDNDVLVVASAGNAGCRATLAYTHDGSIGYPARYDEVVAVAALRPISGTSTASFSSCGADMEIAAPGQSVLSTTPGGNYASFSGTSMAAPHVAGVAGLVLDQNPEITAVQLRCLLEVTADDIETPGRDPEAGWGRINAERALQVDQSLQDEDGYEGFGELCSLGAPAIFE